MNDSNMHILWLATLLVGIGVGSGVTHALRPDCPSADPYVQAIQERQHTIDSLRHDNAYLLDQLQIPNDHPDTITIRIRERLRLVRATGLDSVAAILLADPE